MTDVRTAKDLPRRGAAAVVDWDAITAAAMQHPGEWVLHPLLDMYPNSGSVSNTVRWQRHPSLRRDDGVFDVRVTDTLRGVGNRRVGNVWVRWTPKEA